MSASITYKISFVLAAMDLTIAAVCAINGDSHFVAFMLLAGLMYMNGMYLRAKAEQKEGE